MRHFTKTKRLQARCISDIWTLCAFPSHWPWIQLGKILLWDMCDLASKWMYIEWQSRDTPFLSNIRPDLDKCINFLTFLGFENSVIRQESLIFSRGSEEQFLHRVQSLLTQRILDRYRERHCLSLLTSTVLSLDQRAIPAWLRMHRPFSPCFLLANEPTRCCDRFSTGVWRYDFNFFYYPIVTDRDLGIEDWEFRPT